jgi:hypothetical protein
VSRTRPIPLFAIAAAAAALVLATTLVDFSADDGRIGILDAAAEWSWSHVIAIAAFAGGAFIAVWAAREPTPYRREWRIAAAVFTVLLIDNITRLHTHTGLWPLLYAPLLLGLSAAVWRLARGTREGALVLAGLAALFVSVGFHVLGPSVVHALGWTDQSFAFQVKVGLKEGLELAGWMLVVPGLWRLHRGRQVAAPEPHG